MSKILVERGPRPLVFAYVLAPEGTSGTFDV